MLLYFTWSTDIQANLVLELSSGIYLYITISYELVSGTVVYLDTHWYISGFRMS